jgi:hypothetical protein
VERGAPGQRDRCAERSILNFMGPRKPGSTVLCLAALALFIGMHVLVPTLKGRQIHKMVAPQGEFQAIVPPPPASSVHGAGGCREHAQQSSAWEQRRVKMGVPESRSPELELARYV